MQVGLSHLEHRFFLNLLYWKNSFNVVYFDDVFPFCQFLPDPPDSPPAQMYAPFLFLYLKPNQTNR